MKRSLRIIICAICVICGFISATPDKHTTIFVVGDSTAANKDTTGGKVERGWGMMLQQCFDADFIVVDNHAVNGRSSKSFLDEGRWDKVLEKIRPGDYVIIQFGHNDEKAQPARHTDPGSTFDYNLARYVREAREKGGIPVLMNAVARRNFFIMPPEVADDEQLRNTIFSDTEHLVEGDTLERSLGREGSKKLHMWFRPGEEPSLPQGKQDNTHYNIYGAKVVANLLADALCEEIPLLKPFRLK